MSRRLRRHFAASRRKSPPLSRRAGGRRIPAGNALPFIGFPVQSAPMFDLLTTDPSSRARLGRLHTRRGVIDTPAFMPVGTQGSVKALDPRELGEMGTQIILGNTY